MILTNTPPDTQSGNSAPLRPRPRRPGMGPMQPVYGSIDLDPYKTRWNLMRLEAMSKWYQGWRDISRHINPKRGFFEGFVPNYNQQYDYRLIMDGDPAHYARTLAAGMISGLTSPSRPWFKIGLDDPDLEENGEVRLWLEICEKIIRKIFSKANVYSTYQQTYEELGMFGTGCFGMFEDFNTVLRCRSYTVGEYYLGTDFTGRINAFARQYWMTADQIVNEFGIDNCSQVVKRAYEVNQRETYFLVYNIVEANDSMIPGMANFEGKPWRSVTWEAVDPGNACLRHSGYEDFPIMGPRWDVTTTADVYGVGPGQFSLGDIKSLYRMKKDLFLAVQKLADPPVIVDGGVEGNANMLPGGITRSSSVLPNTGARAAYQIQPDVKDLAELIASEKAQIASRFYYDLFTMMIQSSSSTPPTAREVSEKHEEKLILIGPVLDRVQSDMLTPSIDRAFNMALRAGILPPPPQAIVGRELHYKYIGLLAQAQQMVSSAVIEQTLSFVGAMSATFPNAKDIINEDEAVRAEADALGTPTKMIRSQEEVIEIRRQKALQQQAQQQQAEIAAAANNAKVLSQAKVGRGNALEKILGVNGDDQDQPGGGAA